MYSAIFVHDACPTQGGVVVAEHKASSVLEQSYGGINRFSEKRYGDSKVSFYEVVNG